MTHNQAAEIDAPPCEACGKPWTSAEPCVLVSGCSTCGDVARDPRDAIARQGAGSAAYLTPDGMDVEPLADYLARVTPPASTPEEGS